MIATSQSACSRVVAPPAVLRSSVVAFLTSLATATASAQIVFHDASDPEIEWQRDLSSYVADLTFSADGTHVIMSHGNGRHAVSTFDAANGALVREQIVNPGDITRATAVSASGRLAVASSSFIDVFDLATAERVFDRFVCEGCDISALTFSPDSSQIAMQDSHAPRERALGIGAARILDLETRDVVELEAIAGSRVAVAYSRNGGRLLTAHIAFLGGKEFLGFRVWDTMSPRLLYTASFPQWTMGAIAAGPVARAPFVAVNGNDGNIEMRDLMNETVLWSAPMIANPFAGAGGLRFGVELAHVAIAANGSFVVSYERPDGGLGSMSVRGVRVSDSGGIVVRRTSDGSIVAVYDVPGVTALAASPDGKSFVFTTALLLPRLALVNLPR